MIHRLPRLVFLLTGMILGMTGGVLADDEVIQVRTELKTEKAWMGERVSFFVTLFSPGPFSGTPSFRVPELPDTVIAKEGAPVVGSVDEAGVSWITQRHEFSLYTQQVGTVDIPAFGVTFESKDSFLGEAVARDGKTSAVSFVSERPPGTEALSYVVSSATLKVTEVWSAEDGATLEAGDVVTRSITRSASDTSAMFLEPFEPESMEGVKVYLGDPIIEEKSERGVTRVQRTDRLRYQFTRGGTFDIPAITYAWWDPKAGEVESVALEGRGYVAKAPPVPPEPTDWKRIGWISLGVLVLLVAAWRWLWPWLLDGYQRWHRWYYAPVPVAGRAVRKACRANEAKQAYKALVAWKHAAGIDEFEGRLAEQAELLGRQLYRPDEIRGPWNGDGLLKAFLPVESACRKRNGSPGHACDLPPLNPGLS